MKKLYTVTFEVDVVVASDAASEYLVLEETREMMRRGRSLRDEVHEGLEPTFARRIVRNEWMALPEGYDEGCYAHGDDAHTIGELLDAEETS